MNVSENGLSSVEKMVGNKEFEFDTIKMTSQQIMERLEYVCDFLKNSMSQQGTHILLFISLINFKGQRKEDQINH